MKLLKYLLIVCLCYYNTNAQKLSPKASMLQDAYILYEKVTDAPEQHFRFINAFPDNTDDFIDIFNSPEKDQLYSVNHEYLMALKHSGKSYPDLALHKCFSISTELITWSDGPINDLQNTIYELSFSSIDTFIQTISLYNKPAISAIANFLSSNKKGDINPQYSKLVALLEKRQQKRLAKIFNKALSLK